MSRLTLRRTSVTRLAAITEYDRPLVTALVAAKSTALSFGRENVRSDQGLGAIAITIIGTSSDELTWLEQATVALGGHVHYTPIRRADRRAVELETKLSLADAMANVGSAMQLSAEEDAILRVERSTGRPDPDRALRSIVEQGRAVRRRALERDMRLAAQYVAHQHIDQIAVLDRAADRRRFDELLDEYQLMNGGEPAIWPF